MFNASMGAVHGFEQTLADSRSMSTAESVLSMLLRALPVKHGRHRLLHKIKPEHWANTTTVVKTPYKGHELLMDADDLIGWHFLLLRSFDPEVSDVLCAVGQDAARQVMWDIGANKGACAYAVATALPRSQVVLIEPQATLTRLLEHNMRELAPGRFEVHAVGVGVTEETLELMIPGDNKGRASLVNEVDTADYRKVMVPIQTARQIAARSAFGWPTLVKIDVEGFEPQVFESIAPGLAARACECVVFENHPGSTKRSRRFSPPCRLAATACSRFARARSPRSCRPVMRSCPQPWTTRRSATICSAGRACARCSADVLIL